MTAIQWTEQTWNPIVGCSVVSPGCTNCYAMRMAWRLGNNPATPHYAGTVKMVNGNPVWTGGIGYAGDDTLTAPLRRRKPTIWFVNSMGDLFHEDVPDEWIDRVFAVMALCPRHKFQVLTKRGERMRDYLTGAEIGMRHHRAAAALGLAPPGWREEDQSSEHASMHLPLPNVWLGVSAEDQRRADERIPLLLDTPAAVRFVSYEPALGPIDIDQWMPCPTCEDHECAVHPTSLWGLPRLDWVIAGGESGPGARPFYLEWAYDLIQQCRAAGCPVFVKQLGAVVRRRPQIQGVPDIIMLFDPKGGDMAEWPADLRVREMPRQAAEGPG